MTDNMLALPCFEGKDMNFTSIGATRTPVCGVANVSSLIL